MESMEANHSQDRTGFDRSDGQNDARRDALVARYAPFVKLLANRMALRLPPSVSVDDLISAGSIGLLDAIDKFDPSKDVQLKTYAEFRIKGAILDELRQMDWLPRSVRKMSRQMERAAAEVEKRLNRPARDAEIADEMGVDLETYYDMLGHARDVEVFSLDEFVENHGNDSACKRSYGSLISGNDSPLDRVVAQQMKEFMVQEIKSLPQRDQIVISLYYYEGLTLKEIGEVIQLTESRISQIHSRIIARLRSRFKSFLSI